MVHADVLEQVRSEGLLEGGEPLLAMISGGRDSTCLLDVLVTLRGPRQVGALHVNYGLREQSGADERHCRELCAGLGVELEVVGVPRPPSGPGNLQAWARELRYSAAHASAARAGALLASGHTASDQVETILYRLAASPGRRALLGMRAREGSLLRPLLAISREQTAAYCHERGLRWREDESNADPRFARTRVREGLLPALAAVHPAAQENVLRTAQLLREETDLLESLVDAELRDGAGIAIARLAELPPALARMVVVRLAERASGTYAPQAGERVAELITLGLRGGRAELHVGGLAGAVIDGGRLSMVRLPARAGAVPAKGD
ncbi:MAG TPA: tRNA lysidine(34) synthetase TilS [Solirubrobacteraceae bacterium]|nr:tRNA lysidine(34) synthetase TilS [Solirubrobacteraceae bacterium]